MLVGAGIVDQTLGSHHHGGAAGVDAARLEDVLLEICRVHLLVADELDA